MSSRRVYVVDFYHGIGLRLRELLEHGSIKERVKVTESVTSISVPVDPVISKT